MFRAIKRSLTEAVRGMVKNGLMTVTSLFVVSACIFVFGVFLMLILNSNFLTSKMEDSYEVKVYIERSVQKDDSEINVFVYRANDADEIVYSENVETLRTKLLGIGNIDVSTVTFKTESQIISDFKNTLGEDELISYNEIMPGFVGDCFVIKLNDELQKDDTLNAIVALENVQEVMDSDGLYEKLALLGNVPAEFNDTKYEEVKEKLKQEILAIENVDADSMEFLVGVDEFKKYKETLSPEELESYKGLPDDLLPDAYKIRLKNLSKASETVKELQALDNVESVINTKELVQFIDKLKGSVKTVSIWVIVVFAIVSLFIISNTIKLTVHNRRKEINIMKYVGATDSYIRGPFIMEGVLVGLISAIIAFFVSMWSYQGLMAAISESGKGVNLGADIMTFAMMWKDLLLSYLGVGVFIGAFGSFISVRRYLHV